MSETALHNVAFNQMMPWPARKNLIFRSRLLMISVASAPELLSRTHLIAVVVIFKVCDVFQLIAHFVVSASLNRKKASQLNNSFDCILSVVIRDDDVNLHFQEAAQNLAISPLFAIRIITVL